MSGTAYLLLLLLACQGGPAAASPEYPEATPGDHGTGETPGDVQAQERQHEEDGSDEAEPDLREVVANLTSQQQNLLHFASIIERSLVSLRHNVSRIAAELQDVRQRAHGALVQLETRATALENENSVQGVINAETEQKLNNLGETLGRQRNVLINIHNSLVQLYNQAVYVGQRSGFGYNELSRFHFTQRIRPGGRRVRNRYGG